MFRMVHAGEIPEFLKQKDLMVVDLRSRREYKRYHLRGAENYPYEEREKWEHTLPKNRKILFYCDRGNESMKEAGALSKKGYHTYTLIGGIHRFRMESH